MKQGYLISVIVPVFNLEKYIERTVKSILNQSYNNLEIILVDDGSTDNSYDIIKEMEKNDSRIKAVHQENGGVTSARLKGAGMANGEWISFIDGDDLIDEKMYEILLDNAEKYEAEISHCGYQMIFPDRTDYYHNTGKTVVQDNHKGLKDLLEGEIVEPGLCNKLYSKKIIKALLTNEKMNLSIKNNEDLLMNFYLFNYSKRSIFFDKCLYSYLIRKGSATTEKSRINYEDPLNVLKTIEKRLVHSGDLWLIVNRRIMRTLMNIIVSGKKLQITGDELNRCRAELKHRKNNFKGVIPGDRIIKMSDLALFSPTLFKMTNNVYSRIKGTYGKYELR